MTDPLIVEAQLVARDKEIEHLTTEGGRLEAALRSISESEPIGSSAMVLASAALQGKSVDDVLMRALHHIEARSELYTNDYDCLMGVFSILQFAASGSQVEALDEKGT